jgi:hypothetical protein
MVAKFNGMKKEISEAWLALKWGAIASFLYKREQVDQFIQEEFVHTITNLMEAIERIQSVGNVMLVKEVLAIDEEVIIRREALKKNKELWMEAWRSY